MELRHGNGATVGNILARHFQGDLVQLTIAIQGLETPLMSLVDPDEAPDVGDAVDVTIEPSGVIAFRA
ncbi:MAG: TOBE domain-containing protein [Pseudomonadota bacterium]